MGKNRVPQFEGVVGCKPAFHPLQPEHCIQLLGIGSAPCSFENPGELVDVPDRWRVRIDAPAEPAIGLADVMEEGEGNQPSAGDGIERNLPCRLREALPDGGLVEQCLDNGVDIGGMIDQAVPAYDLLIGITIEFGPQRYSGCNDRELLERAGYDSHW